MWTATGPENRGDRKVGGSTPQLSAIFRMVGREVRHRVASAGIPKGYGGSIPSPSATDGWQSGNAARWKRAEPARARTFDPCTVRHFRACSPNRQEAPGRDPGQCWFESSRAHQCRASPNGRGPSLKARSVPVRVRGAAPRVPISPDGCKPSDCETGEGRRPVRVWGNPPSLLRYSAQGSVNLSDLSFGRRRAKIRV